jgi:hypothetical protein
MSTLQYKLRSIRLQEEAARRLRILPLFAVASAETTHAVIYRVSSFGKL